MRSQLRFCRLSHPVGRPFWIHSVRGRLGLLSMEWTTLHSHPILSRNYGLRARLACKPITQASLITHLPRCANASLDAPSITTWQSRGTSAARTLDVFNLYTTDADNRHTPLSDLFGLFSWLTRSLA